MKILCCVIQDKREGVLGPQYWCEYSGDTTLSCYCVIARFADGEEREIFLNCDDAKRLAVSPAQFK